MRNPHATLSIVTPSYNQGKYIEETMKSVLSQEGDFFIDYIIMDGGSSDNSVEIIRKYDDLVRSGAWERKCFGIEFRWISEKDGGQAQAVNNGFNLAKGDIVSWINSDDMYCDGAFSFVVEHFRNHPEDDFVFGDGDVVDEHGKLQWEWLSRPYDYKLLKSYHCLWNDFTNYIMQQATFWRRDVLNRIGMLDATLHYAMDVEYWIRAGAAGLTLTHTARKLGKFRMILGTKSLSSPTAFWPDMLEIFRRYNGADKMAGFFSYYFYNIARACDYDMGETLVKGSRILERWKMLDSRERETLENEMNKGFVKSFLISMNKALIENGEASGLKIYNVALQKNALLVFHPRVLIFRVKCLLGRSVSLKLNGFIKYLIDFYRQRKYQYRYLEK